MTESNSSDQKTDSAKWIIIALTTLSVILVALLGVAAYYIVQVTQPTVSSAQAPTGLEYKVTQPAQEASPATAYASDNKPSCCQTPASASQPPAGTTPAAPGLATPNTPQATASCCQPATGQTNYTGRRGCCQ